MLKLKPYTVKSFEIKVLFTCFRIFKMNSRFKLYCQIFVLSFYLLTEIFKIWLYFTISSNFEGQTASLNVICSYIVYSIPINSRVTSPLLTNAIRAS